MHALALSVGNRDLHKYKPIKQQIVKRSNLLPEDWWSLSVSR